MKSATSHYICSKLSKRELEVLQLISYEHTSQQIAKELYISDSTVEYHRKNIMDKLGARNTAGMVRRGIEKGILSYQSTH